MASTDARPLALLRIGTAALVVADVADRLRDFHAHYTAAGLAPPVGAREWALPISSEAALLALFGLTALAGLLVLCGLFTRAALVVLFVALVSLQRRNPYVEDGGDAVLAALVFWLCFIDCAAIWSLDVAWRGRPRRAVIAGLPVRLLQVQIASIYLIAFLAKTGSSWQDGSAIERALRTADWARGAGPWLASHPTLCWLLSRFTLGFEAAFAPLVFWPTRWPLRALALGAGLALHLGIFLTLRVGWFWLVMPLAYLAFVPGAWLPAARPPSPSGANPPRRSAAAAVALSATLAVIVAAQVGGLIDRPLPRPLSRALGALGLRQDWRLFAPDVPRIDVSFRAPGTLTDGRAVELTSTTLRPLGPQVQFTYSRWHRLRHALALHPPGLLEALGRYTCRAHDDRAAGAGLAGFELWATVRAVDLAPGSTPSPPTRWLRQSCVAAPDQR